jgi:predicted GIY-YIG superfamily endonuclease
MVYNDNIKERKKETMFKINSNAKNLVGKDKYCFIFYLYSLYGNSCYNIIAKFYFLGNSTVRTYRYKGEKIYSPDMAEKFSQYITTIKERKKKGKDKEDFIYFIRIGAPCHNLYKIGTTNNMERRMKEHENYYGEKVTVLWQSPPYSKWTTLRVEENTKEIWKKTEGFEYLRNDRFVINPEIRQVKIKVRKEWVVDF